MVLAVLGPSPGRAMPMAPPRAHLLQGRPPVRLHNSLCGSTQRWRASGGWAWPRIVGRAAGEDDKVTGNGPVSPQASTPSPSAASPPEPPSVLPLASLDVATWLERRPALLLFTGLLGVLGEAIRLLSLPLRLLLSLPLRLLRALSARFPRSGAALRGLDAELEAAPHAPPSAARVASCMEADVVTDPRAVALWFERRCLGLDPDAAAQAPGARVAASARLLPAGAAAVRAYISALTASGELARFRTVEELAAVESERHRCGSLAGLLGQLHQVLEPDSSSSSRPLAMPVLLKVSRPPAWARPLAFGLGLSAGLLLSLALRVRVLVRQARAAEVAGPGGGEDPTSLVSAAFARHGKRGAVPDSAKATFKDVRGCEEARAELAEVVEYLKTPERFVQLGARLPKGVLLTGPPGTGKTLLARAVAGEAGVPFFFRSGSEFEEMLVGVGASRVRALFETAKAHAPCIVFIDELDAVGAFEWAWKKDLTGSSRMTLNQLLTEMDGFEAHSGVVVLAATNIPEVLDPALLRPGRFDRQVAVPLPDVAGRRAILELCLGGKPLAADVSASFLARRTPGFSGAELSNLVNEAALMAARRGLRMLDAGLLDDARDKVLLGSPRALVQSEAARRQTAYHEAGHALVALVTPGATPIHKATVVPRGHALGMLSQVPDADELSLSREQLLARIDVGLGGRAAEEVVFGAAQVSTGAASDLRHVSEVARHMVAEAGMSAAVGPVALDRRACSEAAKELADAEVAVLLKAGYARARAVLEARRPQLDALARALLERETLTQDEIRAVVEGDVGGKEEPAKSGTLGGVRPEVA